MRPKKIAVFDMDETLGSFSNLGSLKDVIESYEDRTLSQTEFNQLIDENPEFIRPNMVEILRYLVGKREQKECDAIMMYTNNTGGRSWPRAISNYFDHKVGQRVFNQIIAAYKVNGRHLEKGRTSHDKSYADFLRCTGLRRDTKVCFVDDVMHPFMKHPNVSYVHVKPYSYSPPLPLSIRRRYDTQPEHASRCLMMAVREGGGAILRGASRTMQDAERDKVTSDRIMSRMYMFFQPKNPGSGGTRRRKRANAGGGTGRGRSGNPGRFRSRHCRP